MSAEFKIENGKALVRKVSGNIIPVSRKAVYHDDVLVRISVFSRLNPTTLTMECLWVMDKIKLSMVVDTFVLAGQNKAVYIRGNNYQKISLEYHKPVVAFMPNIADQTTVMLLDESGKVLSGSNVYNFGALCLGETNIPFSYRVPHNIMFGEPNTDLDWYGSEIQLKDVQNRKIIETWPSLTRVTEPLGPVIAAADAWWNS